ncbi:SGNH/GDSL hydrolase family protein [Chitinophaga nivalis]|uniref:SGNH/GDSL hydrolase family protein n=1 Tax=Chitinophaga nivalis TaxID=2991709 RepID=A0ABT3IRX1_9BACT|nr:SGNH/GDSL hydrolase family protein [Chitinophaga nivalis]MCW3463586.1 SGNH/GDSL hydrolase family protein [Chitinophaga nivalis]MCW3486724.1 SGNH/GDSL hydrolase family protein [Chitinophaga nivalis]
MNTSIPPVSYLALGDSYTIGESVPATECFPVQVVNILRSKGFKVDDPRIVATTGWTTDELEQGIREAQLTGTYRLVTLLIGVNNQYRGYSVEAYKAAFEALLEKAIAFADHIPAHVTVLSIPDWGVTPFAADRDRLKIAAEIDAYNAANKAIAHHRGVAYLDITPFTREAAADTSLVAADGLHPSGKDYTRWATALAPLLAGALQ